MFYNGEYRPDDNFEYGNDIDININNANMNSYNPTYPDGNNDFTLNMQGGPIIEAGQERYVQRNILHEVRHICPINTRIINNHIFKHTYQPHYTCCEENVVTNQQCGSCCQFK